MGEHEDNPVELANTVLVPVREAEAAVRASREVPTNLGTEANLFDDPTMEMIIDDVSNMIVSGGDQTVEQLIAARAVQRVPDAFKDSENLTRDVLRKIISEIARKMPSEFTHPEQLSIEERMSTFKKSFREKSGLGHAATISWLGVGENGSGKQIAQLVMQKLHESSPYFVSWMKAAGLGTMYNSEGNPNPLVKKHVPARTYVAWLGDNLESAIKLQLAAIKVASGPLSK